MPSDPIVQTQSEIAATIYVASIFAFVVVGVAGLGCMAYAVVAAALGVLS